MHRGGPTTLFRYQNEKMFGFSLLIVAIAALAATGLTALGLRVFFRLLDSASASEPMLGLEHSTRRD